MNKVLIADDEARIRRGIRGIIDWNQYGLEVVGEAEDGEMALEIAKEVRPDIFLLDICMPFLNGLDLISEINKELNDPVIIIISGHDEFKYAQSALQMKVFDYILKPIDRQVLREAIIKANEEANKRRKKEERDEFALVQLEKSNIYLKENFLRDLVNGNLIEIDIQNEIDYFNIDYSRRMGIMVLRMLDKRGGIVENRWQQDLICYAIENISKEVMVEFDSVCIFTDSEKQVVIISDIYPIKKWHEMRVVLENEISKFLKVNLIVEGEFLGDDPISISTVYSEVCERLNEKSRKTPIVIEVQKYIERNYFNENLCMSEISEKMGISQTYITRLLKKELGMTFIDYLTSVRIEKAIILLDDPTTKIYEVAELVGYSTQHYFSNVFKRYMGISPLDYKRRSSF